MATNESRVILIDDLRSFVDGRSAETARTSSAGVTKMAQALRHWGYRVRIAAGAADVGYLGGPDAAG